eukprot:COSAG01_NODE_1810_length_9181_cov_22.033142_1_plen_76_part_00
MDICCLFDEFIAGKGGCTTRTHGGGVIRKDIGAEGTRYLDDLPMRFIALKERAKHLLILRVGVVENTWLPTSGTA